MATKADFTPDEWQQLLEGVMMSGMAVSMAEPSGLWGMLKEGFSSAGALAKAKIDDDANPLIKAMVDDFGTSEGRSVAREGLQEKFTGRKPPEIKAACIDTLRQVSALLDQKAPNDAAAVKAWLRDISQGVAEASSEGGFLGFGGVQVSDAETATLGEISGALGLQA